MSLLIKKAGILTTIQDLGRDGFRRFGINQNGAMDRSAVRLINALFGNEENTAVLEMHFPAAEILFEESTIFALGGADFSAALNDRPIENWRPFFAPQDSILRFHHKSAGNRAYLTVKEGFRLEKWLGSASTNLKAGAGGFAGRKLHNGDRLTFNSEFPVSEIVSNFRISNSLIPFYSKFPTVRVIAGAEFERLTDKSRDQFFQLNFQITQNSDRMGYRLKGEQLFLRTNIEMVSSAVNFGTIQLLPDGQLIVLMADHQTTGGYPRLANVITADLPLLAQLSTNDKVAFHLVSIEEAEDLSIRFEDQLNLLSSAGKFLY